jgi:hypothetical protein
MNYGMWRSGLLIGHPRVELCEGNVPSQVSSVSGLTPHSRGMLQAIR